MRGINERRVGGEVGWGGVGVHGEATGHVGLAKI